MCLVLLQHSRFLAQQLRRMTQHSYLWSHALKKPLGYVGSQSRCRNMWGLSQLHNDIFSTVKSWALSFSKSHPQYLGTDENVGLSQLSVLAVAEQQFKTLKLGLETLNTKDGWQARDCLLKENKHLSEVMSRPQTLFLSICKRRW